MRQSRSAEVKMGAGTRKRAGSPKTQSAKTRSTKAAGDTTAGRDAEWDAQFDAEFERDRQELEQSGRTLTRVLFFVFLGIAILMLVIAVLTGRSTQQKLARELPALAQITGMTERKDAQGNSFFYPTVAFDVRDGGRYNVQLSEGSWPPQHQVGDLVRMLYDSSDPMDARIESGGGTTALWTWTIVTGILGVAFLLAAVLAWALGRQPG